MATGSVGPGDRVSAYGQRAQVLTCDSVNGSRQIIPETEDRTTFEVSKNFEMFNLCEPQRWKLMVQFSSHETVVGKTF
ncbi:hypothetical protein [Streptomyces sp. ID05-47C]|uniref:hypothetical protein n=1 Tax=Streptomyces sp. ID05-47C TaxID=3028665 RepID=UPI0029A99F28|nr:hypothetical protein [Streptomyces sp. ID05-47C]MDX3568011.1 hypothetical protein [Streptomyces sp. ID05-47C]